ncbi:hypothetical protein GWI33_010333 [Rhynchophorus ferrugineus]|uniref:Uncharacterized protein n=1 Tax=Rhynchophorus ferrugineus TaxID=354439 RepID=A0A834ICD1_RHYFE|nr:hypothetical protein GWI33_010333 [Rhynchophorus ferrugineus]
MSKYSNVNTDPVESRKQCEFSSTISRLVRNAVAAAGGAPGDSAASGASSSPSRSISGSQFGAGTLPDSGQMGHGKPDDFQ